MVWKSEGIWYQVYQEMLGNMVTCIPGGESAVER